MSMKKAVHGWRSNARIKLDPEKVAKCLGKLGPDVTPRAVLDIAKTKSNPMHSYFEWDDTEAAEKYRIDQAKYLIRNLTVTLVREEKDTTTRKYVSLGIGISDGKESTYKTVENVLDDPSLRDQAIRKVWNQLLSIKQRYESFVEFSEVWTAIESAQEKVLKLEAS